MSFLMGLDIGGTKIAGGAFTPDGAELAIRRTPTPLDYASFIAACERTIRELEVECGGRARSLGIGVTGVVDKAKGGVFAPNVPCLAGNPFLLDIEKIFGGPASLGNDASCAALSEAIDGAGAGYEIVYGMIMGTGVGGGLIVNRRAVEGPNGFTGEIGHLPLPFRDEFDGEPFPCGCGQIGCIDKTASGPALLRLYEKATGQQAISASIVTQAIENGDKIAAEVLDRFYTTVAKACIAVLHSFDPDIIVLSGGLNALPGLYEEVPRRWGRYALTKNPSTRFVPAIHGKMSGLRGAAWLGAHRNHSVI